MNSLLLLVPLFGTGAFLLTLLLLRKLYPLCRSSEISAAADQSTRMVGQQLAQAVVKVIREEKRQVIEAAARREAQRAEISSFEQAIGSEIGYAVSERRRAAH